MAEIQDLEMDAGADFAFRINYLDEDGVQVALAAYSEAKLQVRSALNASASLLTLTSGAGLTLGTGTVDITVTDTQTAALAAEQAGEVITAEKSGRRFFYDLLLTDAAGLKERLIQGTLYVWTAVTT